MTLTLVNPSTNADLSVLGKGVFSREDLQEFPELSSAFDRYLSQAFWEETIAQDGGSGVVLVAPTSFHAAGLQKLQLSIERLLNRPILQVETRRLDPVASYAPLYPRSDARGSASLNSQMSLPLPTPKRLDNPTELEKKKRLPVPKFVRSPNFETPLQLARRWASGVNDGIRGQAIWVHGRPGSGKTCLLRQLHEWIDLSHTLVSTDVMKFFHEWRRSLEDKDHLAFVRKYRKEIDVFVLENLDELQGKIRTQQEVLFTVNAILDRGAAIAVSSIRHPLELKEILEPALYSRLFSGLILEMPVPDRPFKERLWRQLVDDYGLGEFPIDMMIQERMLCIPVDTARKANTLFINAIGRLSLKKTLTGADLAELESIHASAAPVCHGPNRNPNEIIDKVARLCGVGRAAILGQVRRADISLARRFVCLALSRFGGLTNATIAGLVEKDPSTVSHALKSMEVDIKNKRNIAEQWNWICSQLGMPLERI